MVIDRQTLVQIVLLFDIDHNDEDIHTYVSQEENVNLSMIGFSFLFLFIFNQQDR
jgi:hypothetical protein